MANLNSANDHTYSLKVQTEAEVEVETINDDITTQEVKGKESKTSVRYQFLTQCPLLGLCDLSY